MTINVGLIGCGGIAEAHIRGYLKVEDAHVSAVCDVVQEHAERRAALAGGAQIFRDISTMLMESDIQAVDICLPHYLHKDAIVAAANAGKHILCEKPLCITLAEANEVNQAVKQNGVTLMCAHNQLFMPPIQDAKRLLDANTFGKIYEIRTFDTFYNQGLSNRESVGWRGQRALSGGGELLDTGYHPSYLLLYLAGSRPVEVTAMLSSFHLTFLDGEDSAQVLVRCANGIVGNIVTSWAYDAGPQTDRFQVFAEKGHLSSNGSTLVYQVRGSEPVTMQFPRVNTFEDEIADFIACLREKRRPLNNEDDGISVLKLILGAYQAAEEKRIVEL